VLGTGGLCPRPHRRATLIQPSIAWRRPLRPALPLELREAVAHAGLLCLSIEAARAKDAPAVEYDGFHAFSGSTRKEIGLRRAHLLQASEWVVTISADSRAHRIEHDAAAARARGWNGDRLGTPDRLSAGRARPSAAAHALAAPHDLVRRSEAFDHVAFVHAQDVGVGTVDMQPALVAWL
jgi:hypothetical protein